MDLQPRSGLSAAKLLEALIHFPSVAHQENEAVHYLQQVAQLDGFRVSKDGIGNFIAEIGPTKGDYTCFVGHIDVVGGEIPIRIENGELWGRGTVDAKGPLVAAYIAARNLKTRGKRIRVIGCVGEETDARGAKALHFDHPPTAIINGEPSGADGVTLGYRGLVRATFSYHGPRVHGGHPDPGSSERVLSAWQEVQNIIRFGTGFDVAQGRILRMEGGPKGINDDARLDIEIRVPPQIHAEEVETALRMAAHQHGATLHITEAMDAVQTDRKHPLVRQFRNAIREEGMAARLKQKTGTSDWNILAPRYPDVPVVAYGPGDSKLDHGPDERISLAELDASVAVLERVFGG